MTPVEIARRFYELFNQRRLDEAGQLVHPEAVFEYVPTKQRLIGRAGYRALAAGWLIAFDDAELELQTIRHSSDDTVLVDFVGRGTHSGELVLGEGFSLPATGRRAMLPFHETMQVRNGLIVQSRLDFDIDELRRRLT